MNVKPYSEKKVNAKMQCHLGKPKLETNNPCKIVV